MVCSAMSDSFTEVTSQGWFSRIGDSIKGIVFGLLMVVVSVPLLFWNEGRAVKRYKTLQEGAAAVVSVASDKVDAANEGKLVHLSGLADTEETLTDGTFGVAVKGLKLRRTAEMFQWKESKSTEKDTKLGGKEETKTTYSYSKEWSSSLIKSSSFEKPGGHENPGSMPVQSQGWQAKVVTLGAFTMTDSLVRQINSWEGITIAAGTEVPAGAGDGMKVADGGFYLGATPGSPAVGDVRISFEKVMPSEVSVVTKQVQGSFAPYVSKVGGSLELLQTGVHTPEEMFAAAEASNRMMTWLLRLGGFLLMFFGLSMLLRPFRVVADVLPFAGTVVGMGIGFVSFVVAAIISLVVIAIAWIFYRPLLGISLLVLVVGLIVWLVMRRKKTKVAMAG